MKCKYSCDRWRQKSAAIKVRDGARCRGCGRFEWQVALQVHHRTYGKVNGECGDCWLTGVSDEDLTTFCIECHKTITSIRRGIRHAKRVIEITLTPPVVRVAAPIRLKPTLSVGLTPAPSPVSSPIRTTLNLLNEV